MAMTLPRTLTPSKMTSFTNCPLAFRFTVIDHRPEPPSPQAVKGTLVHAALEGLFWHYDGAQRTKDTAHAELARAWAELASDPEFVALSLTDEEAAAFVDDARVLVDNYFALEDPRGVRAIGVELGVEVERDGMRLRGIIDRLDLADNGDLTVVDYKTGRAPSRRYENRASPAYRPTRSCARSCSGAPPSRCGSSICATRSRSPPSPTPRRSRGQEQKTVAVERHRAGVRGGGLSPEDRPLCRFCHFQSECPAFGAS